MLPRGALLSLLFGLPAGSLLLGLPAVSPLLGLPAGSLLLGLPAVSLLLGLPAKAYGQSAPGHSVPMPDPAAPAGFTPGQRAEIVRIMRDALKTDPSILRDAVQSLRSDDQQQQAAAMRTALAGEQANLTRNPADQVAGNPQGDVTLVVFYDPRCPYCRRLNPTLAALLAADPGVRLVYKDMPILGPASVLESHALLAAQKQNGYLPLMEALMQAPPDATPDMVRAQAEKLGLDWSRLKQDMDAPAVSQRLDGNIALARRLGIEGTPALVVGHQLIPGAAELTDLQQAVAEARHG